jgi:hypothetical protein
MCLGINIIAKLMPSDIFESNGNNRRKQLKGQLFYEFSYLLQLLTPPDTGARNVMSNRNNNGPLKLHL